MQRRNFLAVSAAAGTLSWLQPQTLFASNRTEIEKRLVVLFQGDSITDAGRNKKEPVANSGLGRGYPNHVAEAVHKAIPEKEVQIHNRGISGNKVPDLDRRWRQDCLDLQPDILSILIGVNDIWHALNGRYDGTAEDYRSGYAALLDRTQKALPKTQIVVCEPFVLMSGTVKQNKDKWFPEFDKRREIAKAVATEAKATWVPFQTMFDDAVAAGTSAEALARDGVHPSQDGHALMAKTWREIVGI